METITSQYWQLLDKRFIVVSLRSEKIHFVSCRSMEDGQIGTVKFVGPDQEERCVVQLYVTYRNNLYAFMIYLIFRSSISLFILSISFSIIIIML